jgi:hypothetical protein
MTADEGFKDLQEMIENAVMVATTCRSLCRLLETGPAEKNRAIGFEGMAERTRLMKAADFERWDQMSDEYTQRAKEAMHEIKKTFDVIVSVAEGLIEMRLAKQKMEARQN